MRAPLKTALWEGLSLVQDYLLDGTARERAVPPMADGPLAVPGSAEAAAAPEANAARLRSAATPPVPIDTARPSVAPPVPGFGPEGSLQALPGDSLDAIAAEVGACAKCRLREKRNLAVSGMGAERPLVMVVGEGPGADEDAQGLPFVGAAGKLLDKMLASIGLFRDRNAFIANVVKCRPPMNRDPAPDEESACLPYLLRQMALLRPAVILTVGRIPTQALLATREPVTRLRGRFFSFKGIPLLPTYHPSALLRDEGLKRPAWEDLKLLRERLVAEGRLAAGPPSS